MIRLLDEDPDLGCPVCGAQHRGPDDCNTWPTMPHHPTYPFLPAPAPELTRRENRRGKRDQ